MQFEVPRFLDIEDKVIGPLTFKQFIYLTGGIGLAYLTNRYLGSFYGLGFLLSGLFILIAIGLSFWKPNQRPAFVMFYAFLTHYTKKRVYVWQKPTIIKQKESGLSGNHENTKVAVPRLDKSKISALAWSLDILDREEN
jgi:hypothetical protein